MCCKLAAVNLRNHHIIIFILAVAAILRFWNYFEIPFMHDEFSALFRTGFTNFHELIERGVKTDTHPAGVQVFMNYWILLFGDSPWIVKLPFTLLGIGSIYLVYKIGQLFFTETAGIISSSLLAVIQYHIMYSQLARPYISGVFLSLLMARYWCKLVKNPDKYFWKHGLLMALAGAACAYNHHFSLLQAALIGVSGLFFIPKNHLLKYVGLGLLIFILYLPHLSIFLGQLSQGGVGGAEGWLGAPDISFLWNYVNYIFHFSNAFLIVTTALILTGIFMKTKGYDWKKTAVFSLWFILPFLIGYFYSVLNNPVLQYSVIIFGFPFLLLGITGLMKDQTALTNSAKTLIIIIFGTISLISGRLHYQVFYNSPYEEFLVEQNQIAQSHPNYLRIIDSYPKTNDHYNQTFDIDTTYLEISEFESRNDFLKFLEENHQKYEGIYFGQYERGDLLSPSIISNYYSLDSVKHYAGGSSYWFEKSENKFVKLYTEEFHSANENSNTEESVIESSTLFINQTEYALNQTIELKDQPFEKNSVLEVNIQLEPLNEFSEIFIVTSLHLHDSIVRWDATNISDFKTDSTWINARHAMRFPEKITPEHTLKVYLWNKDKIKLNVDYMYFGFREANPYLYGLYNEIK